MGRLYLQWLGELLLQMHRVILHMNVQFVVSLRMRMNNHGLHDCWFHIYDLNQNTSLSELLWQCVDCQ